MIYKLVDCSKDRPVTMTVEIERFEDGITIFMEDVDNDFAGGFIKVSLKDWDEMIRGIQGE